MVGWWRRRPRSTHEAILWAAGVGVYKIAEDWFLDWLRSQIAASWPPILQGLLDYLPIITWMGAAAAFVWLTLRLRPASPGASNPLVGTPPAPIAEPDILGKLPDGRWIVRVDNKLVEFDSWAKEFHDAQDHTALQKLFRTIRASRRTQYNRGDLEAILAGRVPDQESVYPIASGGFMSAERRARFWTKSEIAALSGSEQANLLSLNSELGAWTRGHSWYDSLRIIHDGCDVLRPKFDPTQRSEPSIATGLSGLGGFDLGSLSAAAAGIVADESLRSWYERAKRHLGL